MGRKLFSLALLSFFLAIVTTINLCHTDSAVGKDPYCPACNFQSSCMAIEIVEIGLLPDLAPFEILNNQALTDYSAQIIIGFPARPPPGI